ncbi:helix-loop-helix DNA-binding domain-containing protein [Drechmeria coniospora]|uniref:Helix-loop-helix DNA-binding domain-containing protein n=1 Tax=Drechmeria coniospora TaxID=98403 RepID=A0A151GDD4_DRECN|nr:helix-loop-helix DNA-binding domain-containing protein [Drechmeria coniospora]KYK55085.1 helix-loop-helix DNA-binding domain-containing protein [Drechmeria coniospora]ODA82290.1 hypothetical protein RJ55_00797 [Drechmeria coniospora]
MDDDVGNQLVDSSKQQASSVVSPDSNAAQPVPFWDSSTPGSSSRMSNTFEFTSAPSEASIPSFDPAIAAFADMSFIRPSGPSPQYAAQQQKGLPAGSSQPECFHRRDQHDKKRLKPDPDTPALDSMDYWINFDGDLDEMGSFEIDYSNRNDPTGQNRAGTAGSTMPGLGSGQYSAAMAPFREEDFIDDTAFDQALSDDEDLFDSAHLGEQMSEMEKLAPPQPPQPPPPLPMLSVPAVGKHQALYASPQAWDRVQLGMRPPMAPNDMPRQFRRDIWDALPHGANQVLSPEEQRRLLEIALNTGRMPGSFIPPNGFGIGFGAGLGARPPAEFEKRAALTAKRRSSSASAPKAEESSADGKRKQQDKKPAATKAGPSKKPGDHAKPKSADRIAHNDVERKYRTNLKDRIAELRDAVPALHSPAHEAESDGGSGQQGAAKVSKGTVLTKATEYIQLLEQRNKDIMTEHQQLARRLQAFETLFNSVTRPDLMMPNHSMALFDPRGFC